MTLSGQRRPVNALGRFPVAGGGLVVLALALSAVAIFTGEGGDHPLVLLSLPIALAAVTYGVRGGLAMGGLEAALAVGWWFDKGQPGTETWVVLRSLTYVLIGVVVGRVADSRAALLARVAHHNELSLDLIATASFEGRFTRVNPAFSKTLGFTSDELTSRPLMDFVHPDDWAATLEAIRDQTALGRDVFQFQNRYRTTDGSYRWLEWTSRPDEKARELVAVARDVTERKRLEEVEREHKRLLEDAVRDKTRELQATNAELEEARRETLRLLAHAAEYRDDDTHQHTERIGRAAALLAAQLGWAEADVLVLRDAAPLHDVGKLAVSDSLLLKRERLTPEELELMKRHAATGAAILAGSDFPVLKMAVEIARTHHEWWDGGGYPLGLEEEEIPLTGRIVAVVDVFDALTHRRPYKPAWSVSEAIAEIHRLTGRQFDPAVVAAFDKLDPHALVEPDPERATRRNLVAVA